MKLVSLITFSQGIVRFPFFLLTGTVRRGSQKGMTCATATLQMFVSGDIPRVGEANIVQAGNSCSIFQVQLLVLYGWLLLLAYLPISFLHSESRLIHSLYILNLTLNTVKESA